LFTLVVQAMKFKFPDFDAYQLGKYNKEGKIKRKKKKAKKEKEAKQKALEDGEEVEEEVGIALLGRCFLLNQSALNLALMIHPKAPAAGPQKAQLTLKQMIRQLHISEPVEHVMCILGKKYPSTEVTSR
jgi:telomerase protein component 1